VAEGAYILWDESQIWGLLVHRALAAWGVDARLVTGAEAAEGRLRRDRPDLLIVPGGFARRKSASLGGTAMAAIRDYVDRGGMYLGFCGGAGLALSGDAGLALCPWTRKPFTDRLHHFLSGHYHVRLSGGGPLAFGPIAEGSQAGPISPGGPDPASRRPLLPVWWPGQFEESQTSQDPRSGPVSVLAAYDEPGEDFWVADLPLACVPPEVLADWEGLYGVSLRPDFLAGRPCVVEGTFGRGRYLLSYAHLETPLSPEANGWLARILHASLGRPVPAGQPHGPDARTTVPDWDLAGMDVVWEDPALLAAKDDLEAIIRLGADNLLLFWRTSWLLGWRRGIPGSSLNNLYALLRQALGPAPAAPAAPKGPGPNDAARAFWQDRSHEFARLMRLFRQGATGYLMAERLAMTVSREAPGAVPARSLKEQRAALFGPPPAHGGLCGELAATLDELVRLLLRT
jgi:hypothetical protein